MEKASGNASRFCHNGCANTCFCTSHTFVRFINEISPMVLA
jgi:hypothetical protein